MKILSQFYNSKKYRLDEGFNSVHKKVIRSIKNNSVVLDVGCADGYIGKELKNKNCSVYGIEISKTAADNAEKYYEKITVGNIEEVKLPWKKQYFDVIILLDILEHLFDPQKTLVKLKNYLNDSGMIIVSLPNVANWEIRWNLLFGKFEYTETGLLDNGHIRLFTYATAVKLIENSGYVITSTDCVATMPNLLSKINNRFPFLNISKLAMRFLKTLFAYQYIFFIKKTD